MNNFKVFSYKSLDSTNAKAKDFIKKGLSNLVVAADKQNKGKGRFKRKWSSEAGGLYMTISIKEDDLSRIKYLTLMASLSVNLVLKKLKFKALVKWPNDVLVDNKKICGILTETIFGKESYALVGIGLNVNQARFPKSLEKKATSLFLESNKQFNIKKILKSIMKEFENLYKSYNNERYDKIISLWKKNSHTLGKQVKVKSLSMTYIGKAVSIDKDCNLVLKLKNGNLKKIIEGDISIV